MNFNNIDNVSISFIIEFYNYFFIISYDYMYLLKKLVCIVTFHKNWDTFTIIYNGMMKNLIGEYGLFLRVVVGHQIFIEVKEGVHLT
jgi:hypothetical protein